MLVKDTKLFIDPFLIFKFDNPFFKGAHDKLIGFFNEAFKLASKSGNNHNSLSYKKLSNMLLFPEVEELCLGFSNESTRGSGSGYGYRESMIKAIYTSIKLGITKYDHFEEIGIFDEGIGCDRISDITANILKKNIIEYTQHICNEYNLPMEKKHLRHVDFDFNRLRWESDNIDLPINPFNKKAVLLVPEKFLRELPVISPDEFWDFLWDNKKIVSSIVRKLPSGTTES